MPATTPPPAAAALGGSNSLVRGGEVYRLVYLAEQYGGPKLGLLPGGERHAGGHTTSGGGAGTGWFYQFYRGGVGEGGSHRLQYTVDQLKFTLLSIMAALSLVSSLAASGIPAATPPAAAAALGGSSSLRNIGKSTRRKQNSHCAGCRI
jgi:hypothetical protein